MSSSVSSIAVGAIAWPSVTPPDPARGRMILLFLLSITVHIAVLRWLAREPPGVVSAVPLPMVEIALLAAANPATPSTLPPLPESAPPPVSPAKALPLLKPKAKPKPKPPKQETHPEPKDQKAAPSFDKPNASTATVQPSQVQSETVTEASFHANYLHNPKPTYPEVAKRRGWQGRTIVRVQVAPDGSCAGAEIDQSSGYAILDESALKTVKLWRFVPARRGAIPVASVVNVPIAFHLDS